jgi:hypothetical protein
MLMNVRMVVIGSLLFMRCLTTTTALKWILITTWGFSETFPRFACACVADGRLIDVLDASIARINVPSAIDTPSWAPD